MADITVTVLDGGLGLINSVGQNAIVHAGVCAAGTVGTIYALGDIPTASSTLGPGNLTECVADTIAVAGSCYAIPVNQSVAGTIGATTHVGTGAGTVTGSLGPAYQILAKVSTGGALGTSQWEFSVNGGAYSAPVLSTVTTWSYLVPGTMTTLTFAAQTYTSGDVWTITTAGGITVVGSGTAGWVTQASSPIDGYSVLVTIGAAGGLGAGTFTYSLDGGNSNSAAIQIPSGGVYVIPATGIILTFASTFVAGDTYAMACVTAGFGTTDIGNTMNTLAAGSQIWFGVHVAGQGSTSAGAASMTATVESSLDSMATAFRYAMGIVECTQAENSDTTVFAAFASTVAARVMVCYSDVLHLSSLFRGREIRRNLGVAIASRLAATQPSEDPGFVGSSLGSLANVVAIYRNEATLAQSGSANRFTCATTRPTKAGYYCETGNTMANYGSDFTPVTNRRVMDIACSVGVGVAVNQLNADLLTNPANGTVDDREATRLEGVMNQALAARLINKAIPDVTAAFSQINRTNNILSTEQLLWSIQIVPKAKVKTIALTLGFTI